MSDQISSTSAASKNHHGAVLESSSPAGKKEVRELMRDPGITKNSVGGLKESQRADNSTYSDLVESRPVNKAGYMTSSESSRIDRQEESPAPTRGADATVSHPKLIEKGEAASQARSSNGAAHDPRPETGTGRAFESIGTISKQEVRTLMREAGLTKNSAAPKDAMKSQDVEIDQAAASSTAQRETILQARSALAVSERDLGGLPTPLPSNGGKRPDPRKGR